MTIYGQTEEQPVQAPEAAEAKKEPEQVDVQSFIDNGANPSSGDDQKTTPEERSAFIDSIVAGTRYEAVETLLGGQVKVKFRSRTFQETEAVTSFVAAGLRSRRYNTIEETNAATRLALLSFQVAELNGVSYEVPESPLNIVQGPDGTKDPPWAARMGMWAEKPEGLVNMLVAALQTFEAKYQSRVRKAADVNFWGPGGSTGN